MTLAPFGRLRNGREVQIATLTAGGLRVQVLTLGAILQDLRLDGADWPLVLGSEQIGAYEGPMAWFGAVVGPVANRISGAEAMIAGQRARFEANDGPNTLHGGSNGTSAQIWSVTAASAERLLLRLDLPAGLGGFPGNRQLRAEYRISAPATLELELTATTDAPTLMNLAHHPYWNLEGSAETSSHWLRVSADALLPTDAARLPSGKIAPLGADARDLRAPRRMNTLPPLDHCYVLARRPRPLAEIATLRGARGITLDLASTAPGLQVYDGAGVSTAPWPGHNGIPYGPFAGVALEPQLWPDAPAHPDFPSALLQPGAQFQQLTQYRLSRTSLN